MIKLIAFDWNGTILADTQMNLECSNRVFKNFDMKPITLSRFQQTFDIPVSKFWINNGGKVADLLDQGFLFHKYYLETVGRTRSRAGSKQVLDWLNQHKIKSVIYSNHTTDDIVNQCKRLKLKHEFTKILARDLKIDGHSQVHKRNKEEKLIAFIKTLKLKPKEILTIGDTDEEIEIGKKHGFYTVSITGGYNTTARLKKHHPDFLIHNMKELIGIIKKLNRW